jgi:branched-chain amino acid transport system ATP-binding protein
MASLLPRHAIPGLTGKEIMREETILETQGLSKNFGGLCAVADVNISVFRGEILGLIGPNGAGKTTFFNVIAGMYKPSAGKVLFKSEDIAGLPPHRVCWKGIARTFQQPQPFNGLTVYENVLAGQIFGRQRRGIRMSIGEILDLIEMGDKRERLVENLTAQEQKKIEIGKALACNPELVLLDEVAAGLTSKEQESIKRVVLDVKKKLGITIIMIEHIMETIMNLSDRILVLNNGAILKIGTPGEVATDHAVIEAYLGKEFAERVRS